MRIIKLVLTISMLSFQTTIFSFNPFINDAEDIFGDFIDQEIQMLNQMRQERKRIQHHFGQAVPFSPIKIEIKDQEKENRVEVIIKGITTTEFNAQLNEDEDVLTIKTPNESIKVHAQDKVLAVEVQQQIKQEQKPTKSNDQDEASKPEVAVTGTFVASSVVRSAQRITDELDLEQQVIDYDKASQILTISIPKAKAKIKGKPVPVNIK